jgi:HD-GYP domain-containing protein (c-di-GMP phosphodiesterase class II)
MRSVPVSTLIPNTYFDQQVFLEKGYILLTPDSPVTPDLLKRLQKWKFSQVFTEGKPKDSPGHLSGAGHATVSPQTIDEDIQENERVVEARKFYRESLDFASTLFAEFAATGTLDLAQVTKWVKRAIEMVHGHRDFILRFVDVNADPDRYLITHAVNTTILALGIGDFMKAPPHRLIELGNACLLHEIGMFKLPGEIQRTAKALSPEERKTLSAHTMLGYRILKGVSAPENVALAALEHHERIDGTGYPRNLTGEKITEYARVIGVACTYDAMVSRRPFRAESMDGHSTIKELLQKSRQQYDDRVLKALVYTLSIYPVGSAVLLSNNSRGIVVKTDPSKPRCPVVKILLDPNGKKLLDPPLVQTTDSKGLGITRVLGRAEAQALRDQA